jgi:hypothetical protein
METQNRANPGGERPFARAHFIEKLPQWFTVFAALIYGTGFLIEFTFFDLLGVRGAANDFFKARYIHVGCLFLQFPASLLALVLAFVKMKAVVKEARKKDKDALAAVSVVERLQDIELFTASILLLATLLSGFYLLITFARPGLFAENQLWVSVFFFVIIFGMTGIRELERHLIFKTPESKRSFGNICRSICLGISWIMALIIFWGTIPIVWTMLLDGGYLCYGLLGLIGFIIHRLIKRFSEIEHIEYRSALSVIGVVLIGALYYLAVLGFAGRVYPFIPVIKGGGDYTNEKKAVLTIKREYSNSIPSQLIDGTQLGLKSLPLLIIEETPTSLILSTNDPASLRRPGQTNKPTILTIKKDAEICDEFHKLSTMLHEFRA